MGKFSRDKGMRHEREQVHAFRDAGIAAEKVPLSGAAGGSFSGDLSVPITGVDRRFECKKRKDGFKQIYSWLDDNYALIIGANNKSDLVVLRRADFIELARKAEVNK